VSGKLPQHRRWILLKLQNVATNDRIEPPLKCHFGRIALLENHVSQRPGRRSRPRGFKGRLRPVYADNFTRFTDHVCNEKGNITGATADV
jgi:hypothetical protein